MIEKVGVNVNQLLELLVSNSAAELTTFYTGMKRRIRIRILIPLLVTSD
jgi:ferritin-like protein